MNLLLDSHVFIWSYDEQHNIPGSVTGELSNPTNDLYLSIAGLWELQIKIQIDDRDYGSQYFMKKEGRKFLFETPIN